MARRTGWIGVVVVVAACGSLLESPSTPPHSTPAVDPGRRGWIQIELDLPDPQHLRGLRVRGGTLDGRITIDREHEFPPVGGGGALLRATPFHSEIRQARVVYGYYDGRESHLILVGLETGATTEVVTTNEVIESAAVGEDGSVFYLSLDPATRDERGIYRARPGAPPDLLVPPRRIQPEPVDGSTVSLTPGGEFLLVQDCGFDRCLLRVYTADTGEFVREYPTAARGLLGVFGEAAVAAAECEQAPCRAVALSLRHDLMRPFGIVCDRSRAIELRGEPAVVTLDKPDCLGDARDLIITPVAGGRLPIGRPEFGGMDLVGIAVEPSGSSIVVASDGLLLDGAGGFTVDVETGALGPFELDGSP